MNDAAGHNTDHLRPGDRIAIAAFARLGGRPAVLAGSQGTILRVLGGILFDVVLDDERRVLISANMLVEDDELPRDPELRARVERLILDLTRPHEQA